MSTPQPSEATTPPSWKSICFGFLIVGGLLTLGATLSMLFRGSPTPAVEPETIIAEYAKLASNQDKKGLQLLRPAPRFDDTPISEDEAEARQASHLLRLLPKIVEIRKGQAGKDSGWKSTVNRFTLTTRLKASTPPVFIKTSKGVEGPSQWTLVDPDIIVEVRDGKIHGIRADIHQDGGSEKVPFMD